jgi:hypothetical protein
MSRLCWEFGISRPTGYFWKRRYQQTGSLSQLVERSRRPACSRHKTPEWQERRLFYGVRQRRCRFFARPEPQSRHPERGSSALSLNAKDVVILSGAKDLIHRVLPRPVIAP